MRDNSASFEPEQDDVFGRIADRYDRLCDLFSLGIHRFWKAHMAACIAREHGRDLLDLASGTGDIPVRLWRRLGPECRDWSIRVSDISQPMLAIAERRLATVGLLSGVEIQDACAIDAPDASLDIVSMAFGLKITDRAQVLPEVYRVLRPGGVFLCLEASHITVPGLHRLYLAYMDACMPVIGRLATGGDASAYAYLLSGIHDFPDQRALTAELGGFGFTDTTWTNLSLGIVALHRAVKPEAP
jgi:demethylmenaquinone methyltransferase/2-methoxy-6-polyprenyl-1,4-benzoquinol methylase